MKSLYVGDWMTRKVITGDADLSLANAHRLMRQNNIRRLPVVDHDRLVGIVTRSDIRGAEPSEATSLSIWEINYLLANLKLESIMTKDPITVTAQTTIKEAAELMHKHKIGALPVLNPEGQIVGILTESDIFRILIAWFNEEIEV